MLKSKNEGQTFFLNCRIILLMCIKLFGKVTNRMIYPITIFLHQNTACASITSVNSQLKFFAKFGAKRTGSFLSMAFSISNAFWKSLVQLNFVRSLSKFVNGSAITEKLSQNFVITSHTKKSHQLSFACRYRKI